MATLVDPYYGGMVLFGGALGADPPPPTGVNLDGINYPIDLREYTRRSQAGLRDNVSVPSGQPDDQLYNTKSSWWRYATSWHHGAESDIHDFGPDADPYQFDTSLHFDPWERFAGRNLHYVTAVLSGTNISRITSTDAYVYVGDTSTGAVLRAAAPYTTWNAITGLTGTVTWLASDGIDCYVATNTAGGPGEIFRITPGSTVATVACPTNRNWSMVEFASNRLLAAADNVLYEIAANGNDTAIFTHFQASFRWTGIVTVGSKIYVGGNAGTRSSVYNLITNASGGLVIGPEAAPMSPGESLNHIVSTLGVVVLCSTLGIRLGTIGGDSAITYGPLLEIGNVTHAAAEGRFVWFSSPSHPLVTGLGRLALDEFVEPLRPAWAWDIGFPGGVTPDGVCRHQGVTLYVGQHVWREHPTDFVTEGWVLSAPVTFGTVEPKVLTSLFVAFDPLGVGEVVYCELRDDETGDVLGSGSVTANPPLSVTGMTLTFDPIRVSRCRVYIALRSSGGTNNPTLRSWRLRGYPVVPAVDEWIVPLIVSSAVVMADGAGTLTSQNVLSILDGLVNRWRSKGTVSYTEGGPVYRVRVEDYETKASEWLDTSDGFEQIVTVRLVNVT